MNIFRRWVCLAVVVGMVNLTTAEAYAQAASGAAGAGAASGNGGNGGAGASGGTGAASGNGGNGGAGATGGTGAASGNGGNGGTGAATGGGGGRAPAAAGAPAGGGGSAPLHAAVNAACGADLQLPNPAAYANALDGVEEITRQTQTYLEQCGCSTQACVADALDTYADALQKVAPQLPRALRVLPKIIHRAAQKARVAPTLRVAVKVLHATVVVVQKIVRKAIELMRANDPDATSAATRGGDLVSSTLTTAATVLERADTL